MSATQFNWSAHLLSYWAQDVYIKAAGLAQFKPLNWPDHVFMGGHHPHSRRAGGSVGVLGIYRNAEMAGTRIVSSPDYPFYHRGHVGMKLSQVLSREPA